MVLPLVLPGFTEGFLLCKMHFSLQTMFFGRRCNEILQILEAEEIDL